MDYRSLTTLTSAILIVIGLMWLLRGGSMLRRWKLAPSESALLIGRRIGAIYLGLACLIGLAGDFPPGPAQWAVSKGAFVTCMAIALVGIYELATKRVGPVMWGSVAVECALGVGYLVILV